jgi:hypothetical protein
MGSILGKLLIVKRVILNNKKTGNISRFFPKIKLKK